MSEQKCTKQNWIHLVKYSCAEVSGPFELSWFAKKINFKMF